VEQKIVNIVFGKLAQTVLLQAQQGDHKYQKISIFPDDLSFGPLNPLDGAVRQKWTHENFLLQPKNWGLFPRRLTVFFKRIKSTNPKIICWVCQNSVYELSGFYECIRQITGDNLYYVDTMDAAQFEFGDKSGDDIPPRLAHISPAVALCLIGKESSVSASMRSERAQIWQRLCAENAPLRSIGPQGVESVLISHFDPILIGCIEREWRPAQRIVTRAAVAANNDNFFRVDMVTLTGRLNALIKERRIEADREVSDTAVRVRLP
jgi:Protein of unknown function/Domain of unknown function (DUF1835)